MGWRAQPTAQVQFDDCRVPGQNLIGEEGKGFKYAMAGLDGGRLNIAASALGGAQFVLNSSLSYMEDRKAFGKSLNKFQALQFKLADMEVKLQTARTFLRHAALKTRYTEQKMHRNFVRWQNFMLLMFHLKLLMKHCSSMEVMVI